MSREIDELIEEARADGRIVGHKEGTMELARHLQNIETRIGELTNAVNWLVEAVNGLRKG